MAKQLNIRSDEAYETAQRLASHLNNSATAVVETALKEYAKCVLPEYRLRRRRRLTAS